MTDDNQFAFWDELDAGREWGTPARIWRPLSAALGDSHFTPFDLDPFAGAEEEPIAADRITAGDDPGGYEAGWYGHVWVNPPYSTSHNPKAAEKIHHEASRPEVKTITALVPASTDTQYFHEHYAHADYLCFVEGRIEFYDADPEEGEPRYDGAGTFPSMVAAFEGSESFPSAYLDRLRELGHVRSEP